MGCRASLSLVNSGVSGLAAGSIIPMGAAVHGFGTSYIWQTGSGVAIRGRGQYDMKVSLTLTSATVGTVTAAIFADGVLVPGSSASEYIGTANTPVNLTLLGTEKLCNDCCGKVITVVLTVGSANLVNMSTKIVKE